VKNRWQKMTRWAGLGNNGGDPTNAEGEQTMTTDGIEQDEILEQADAIATEPEERLEAGSLNVELEQLKLERDQLKDRLARVQAEFDNARKREVKERQDAREYTIGSTVEPFLSVMDNFQLALGADGTVEQLRSGVGLILKQMEEALKSLQVTPVDSVGAQFDPRIHEALGSIETSEFPDHQVLEEIRRGYKIRERLLRPAMVRIATNAAQVTD